MKIFIISSASFYNKIEPIKNELESKGYIIYLPNTYDNPDLEKEAWKKGFKAHAELVKEMFKKSESIIKKVDAVLCVNYEKHRIENYIGGATFIEIYEAFKNNKKIFLFHDIPKGMLYDEIAGFDPIVLNENLSIIDDYRS
jgi:hypothetical protein